MGWKNVKTHYAINHIVQVTDEGICIGSNFISEIILISHDGDLVKRYEGANEELLQYQQKMDADPEMLRSLVAGEDSFECDITVYGYKNGELIESACESLGWPNLTHDGILMYDNVFSDDFEVVRQWAIQENTSLRKHAVRKISEYKEEIAELDALIAKTNEMLMQLECLPA